MDDFESPEKTQTTQGFHEIVRVDVDTSIVAPDTRSSNSNDCVSPLEPIERVDPRLMQRDAPSPQNRARKKFLNFFPERSAHDIAARAEHEKQPGGELSRPSTI